MYLVATFDSEAMPDNLLLHRLDAQGTGGDWRGLAGTGSNVHLGMAWNMVSLTYTWSMKSWAVGVVVLEIKR